MVHQLRKPIGSTTPAVGKMFSRPSIRPLRIAAALFAVSWGLFAGPANADDEPLAKDSAAVAAGSTPANDATIDFLSEIQPIFVAHCYKCHGGDQRRGGLKLVSQGDAASGGDSGKPILGGTLETNELYQRVSSADRTYRMPKNADALSDGEIARIRRWVQQQTPWTRPIVSSTKRSTFDRWLDWWASLTDRYRSELEFATPYCLAFMLVQFALLAVVRCGRAYHQSRPWAIGMSRGICKLCSRARPSELCLVWLLAAASLGLVLMVAHKSKLDREIARLNIQKLKTEDAWSHTIFGSPPIPLRLDEPKKISGTYYRGNCERNPALFNNGNYRTAIFRISLCDAQHQPMQPGDPEPEGGVYVRVELERAPGTSELFFSKEMIGSVFFSREFYPNQSEPLRDSPVRLETLEEATRWVAYYPVAAPVDPRLPREGIIYLYTGRIENDTARGDPQYAIVYDLHFVDGKLTDESDLWMNSFGNPAIALPPQLNKIPFQEWFDYREIPAITGPNSIDPKILGVEEYVRKGLIPPQPQGPPPSGAQPAGDQPPANGASDSPTEPRP